MQEGQKIFVENHFYTTSPERHIIFRSWSGQNPELQKNFKMSLHNLLLLLPCSFIW